MQLRVHKIAMKSLKQENSIFRNFILKKTSLDNLEIINSIILTIGKISLKIVYIRPRFNIRLRDTLMLPDYSVELVRNLGFLYIYLLPFSKTYVYLDYSID